MYIFSTWGRTRLCLLSKLKSLPHLVFTSLNVKVAGSVLKQCDFGISFIRDSFGSVEPGNLWGHDATVSKSIAVVSLLTQHVEDWPLSFTLGSSTGACQSRSLGPVLTMTSYPSCPGPLHVLPFFLFCSFLTRKSKMTQFTDSTDRPAGPHQSSAHPKPAVRVPLFSVPAP